MCQCCSGCGRVVLAIMGILTVPLGLGLTAVGIFLLANVPVVSDVIKPFITQFLEQLGISGCFKFATIEVPAEALLTAVAGAILALGLFWFLTGCCGCLGGCCTLEWSLVTYLVIYGICEIAGIVLVILEYTQKSDTSTSCNVFSKETLYSAGFLGFMVGMPLLGGLLIFFAAWVLAYKCKFSKNAVHPI